ncbi:chemotaxis protein CheW [Pseudoneobacillus rhizosphaerae]|uniref:Chemotaxis protein CheW n=1 Tax=Pseudoneobacillus rhizosphaerae TaxID=2880968 RepID=A0A9C7GC76_9BACI|nr:chemotaxis protein CheW [Pseudoneobacillus rhizosphaerae]CAG9609744.1 Chemotaxis protein CheW [Pseudoneobacillus rhizosphaerae]
MENKKIVAFKLGEEEFGLDIDHVHSIERISQITRVPNAPAYIKGVMNLRGQITPIIDLQNILSKNQVAKTGRARILIANYNEMNLGFMVDQTSDVMDVGQDEIVSPSSNGLNFDYLNGIAQIGSRIIMLLNLDELMKFANN